MEAAERGENRQRETGGTYRAVEKSIEVGRPFLTGTTLLEARRENDRCGRQSMHGIQKDNHIMFGVEGFRHALVIGPIEVGD